MEDHLEMVEEHHGMISEVVEMGTVHQERMDLEVEQEGVVDSGVEEVVVILDVGRHLVMCQWVNGGEESRYHRMGMETEAVAMVEVEAEVAEVEEEEGTDKS